jgi:hypothetical protein
MSQRSPTRKRWAVVVMSCIRPAAPLGETAHARQSDSRSTIARTTIDVYTQAITATKRKAQSRVVEMIVPRKRAEAVAGA